LCPHLEFQILCARHQRYRSWIQSVVFAASGAPEERYAHMGGFGIGWDGLNYWTTEYYKGVIDSAAVWDKTLSSSEVAALYDTSDKSGYHLTTKELETDIGLYYFWARWYDALSGRFIQKDEFAELNGYVFCLNDPINAIDITGNKSVKACAKEAWKEFKKCWNKLSWWSGLGCGACLTGVFGFCAGVGVIVGPVSAPGLWQCVSVLATRLCGPVCIGGQIGSFLGCLGKAAVNFAGCMGLPVLPPGDPVPGTGRSPCP
jgi:RHS repeat-associated protein